MTSVPGSPRRRRRRAEEDGLDVGRVGDADDDDLGGRGRLGRAGRRRHAELAELRGAARGPVPGGDLEPGTGQVRGHRRAHRPETKERDALHAGDGTGSAASTTRARGVGADSAGRPGPSMMGPVLRLAFALFAVQAGFHGFTAALPVALARAGVARPGDRPDRRRGGARPGAGRVPGRRRRRPGRRAPRVHDGRGGLPGGLRDPHASGCRAWRTRRALRGRPALPGRRHRGHAALRPLARAAPDRSVATRLRPGVRGQCPQSDPGGDAAAVVGGPLGTTSLRGVALVDDRDGPARTAAHLDRCPSGFDRRRARAEAPRAGARRATPGDGVGFAFRRSWAPLIAIILLFIAHWGVIIAYLPQRAEAAGADIGLFFVADGVAILLSRVPAGWLADRMRPLVLMLVGFSMTAVTIVLLALPTTTPCS